MSSSRPEPPALPVPLAPPEGSDAPDPSARRGDAPWSTAGRWLGARDPGLLAVKRAVRAAVLMPATFGVAHVLFANPQISLFAAFGAFALLLLVEFQGRPRTRLASYLSLVVLGAGLVTLGTVVSTQPVVAVGTTVVVGFGLFFAGILSPQAAAAATAAAVVFVLPVALPGPLSTVTPRLLGWAMASLFCIPACLLVWPPVWHDQLRRHLSTTLAALARLVSSSEAERSGALATVASELQALHAQFSTTPYPPVGAEAAEVALARLVGRVDWVVSNVEQPDTGAPVPPESQALNGATAEALRRSAELVCDVDPHQANDPARIAALGDANRRLDALVVANLDLEVSRLITDDPVSPDGPPVSPDASTALDPAFRSRALALSVAMVADATLEAAGAEPVSSRRFHGDEASTEGVAWRRIVTHLSLRSVWFRNSLRGGIALAIAIAVVEITDVEHGFWVALGTLSVLRSNALGTGATAVRAVAGTAVGFVVGSAVMVGVADHSVLLWILLPAAVLVAGVAPATISFAAGQAGFTLVVVILFNIIDPVGWKVGLTRIEDVAIGCGVSIVVGLLFWPRGATAALGRAIADSFVASSGYLGDAVSRLTSLDGQGDSEPARRVANTMHLRLDDAFRQFLAERGAKPVPVDTVARLFTGTNRIRLAAYTLSTLPVPPPAPGRSELESVATAGAALRDGYTDSRRWYQEFAELLDGRRDRLDPPPPSDAARTAIVTGAFEDARRLGRDDRLRTALRMVWADELLDNQRPVQGDLAASADLFVRQRRRGRAASATARPSARSPRSVKRSPPDASSGTG